MRELAIQPCSSIAAVDWWWSTAERDLPIPNALGCGSERAFPTAHREWGRESTCSNWTRRQKIARTKAANVSLTANGGRVPFLTFITIRIGSDKIFACIRPQPSDAGKNTMYNIILLFPPLQLSLPSNDYHFIVVLLVRVPAIILLVTLDVSRWVRTYAWRRRMLTWIEITLTTRGPAPYRRIARL